MFKKTIAAFLALAFAGCVFFKNDEPTDDVATTNIVLQSDFNTETYVWENFNFPTNRTSGLQ